MPNEAEATPYGFWTFAENCDVKDLSVDPSVVRPDVGIRYFPRTPGIDTVYKIGNPNPNGPNYPNGVVVLNEETRPATRQTIKTVNHNDFILKKVAGTQTDIIVPFDCGWPSGWIVLWID